MSSKLKGKYVVLWEDEQLGTHQVIEFSSTLYRATLCMQVASHITPYQCEIVDRKTYAKHYLSSCAIDMDMPIEDIKKHCVDVYYDKIIDTFSTKIHKYATTCETTFSLMQKKRKSTPVLK